MFKVKYLESLESQEKPYRVYERESRPGFGIRVLSKGAKSFFYAYKIERKQRFMNLGVYGTGQGKVTLKEAGEKWAKAYELKQSGRDPQIVRENKNRQDIEQQREADRKARELAKQGTYEQLLENYIQYLVKEKKSALTVRNVQQAFNANAYRIIERSQKAKEITFDDINETLAFIEQRGAAVMTNRMRAYLSAAFAQGIKSDTDRVNQSVVKFGLKLNPVRDVRRASKEEEAGTRELSKSEVRILWYDLDNTNISLKIIATLKLMIATGQRTTEVTRLNLNDINETEMLWELDKTKNGRPHVIALPEIALEIIQELTASKDGYLLKSEVTGELMKPDSLSQACSRYCKHSGFVKFTPRDLRRTWKTLAGFAGISKFDRDKYQNHAMHDVSSKSYDRYDYLAEKRNVAVVWNSYLSNILLDQDPSIVPIRKLKQQ